MVLLVTFDISPAMQSRFVSRIKSRFYQMNMMHGTSLIDRRSDGLGFLRLHVVKGDSEKVRPTFEIVFILVVLGDQSMKCYDIADKYIDFTSIF